MPDYPFSQGGSSSDNGSLLEEGGSYQHPPYPSHQMVLPPARTSSHQYYHGQIAEHMHKQQCLACDYLPSANENDSEHEHDHHHHSDESYLAYSHQLKEEDSLPVKGAFFLTPSAASMRKQGGDLMEF